jgi:hypothetical protein
VENALREKEIGRECREHPLPAALCRFTIICRKLKKLAAARIRSAGQISLVKPRQTKWPAGTLFAGLFSFHFVFSCKFYARISL